MKNIYLLAFLLTFTVSNAQIVNIPDADFKNALLNYNPPIDTNGDGEIQVSEAEVVIEMHLGSGYYILSLEGIQSFLNLEVITYLHNELNSVDFSQNQSLRWVNYFLNSLTSLDVSNNPNLEGLNLGTNMLTSIDVSQNPNLIFLSLRDNQLTSLDVSNNPNLTGISCYRNQLTSLNIRNGNNHNMINMLAWDNPDLFCIQVDDVNYSNGLDCGGSVSWCKDEWAEYSEFCELGIEENNNISFSLYPNPAQDVLYIESYEQIETIKIYSLQGRLVKEVSTSIVDVSNLKSGMYFLQIVTEGIINNKKFIKN